MPYLLDAGYLLLLALLSPWILVRAIVQGKYREGYAEKLLGRVPCSKGDRPCVWFHAVSVGEVNLLRPLVAQVHSRWPDWDCVISTTTKTGHALALARFPEVPVFYCPLDFSWAVRRAMQRVRPDLLVLVELELWPNLVLAARRAGAKVAIVNGRLSDSSYAGYRRIRPLARWLLAKLDLVAVQNRAYADRFLALGAAANAVYVTGSVKFDGAESDRNNPGTTRLRQLVGLPDDAIVLLAGSTQDPEEMLAVDTFRALAGEYPKLRLVLVPRHPERFDEVARRLAARGVPFVRRSELIEGSPPRDWRMLLVDAVGELGAWWGTARIAFVGGSLTQRGGQNMIEPAAYGAAVCFGPNTWNFRDVVAALLQADAAHVVHDGQELTAFVRRCLTEPRFAKGLGRRARALVLSQLGATERTLDLLEKALKMPPHGATCSAA